jgi:hypothetical protein
MATKLSHKRKDVIDAAGFMRSLRHFVPRDDWGKTLSADHREACMRGIVVSVHTKQLCPPTLVGNFWAN